MKVFFDDDDLDGQFQRTPTHAYERAADLGEAFAAARRITPGDNESWYREWAAAVLAASRSAQDSRDAGRAATAAEVCDPGQPDLGARVRDRLPASVLQLIKADDPRADQILAPMLEADGGGHIEGLAQQAWNGYVLDWLDTTLHM